MRQAFITTYGSVVFEKEHLYIRNVDVPFSRTAFAQISWEAFFMAAFVLQFYRSEGPFFYVGIIIWSLFLIDRLPRMFDLLFKRSYANRIPIQSILSFDQEEDLNGLEAIVRLHLSNGRYRRLRFRKLEHQLELFTEQLSQYLSVPKTA